MLTAKMHIKTMKEIITLMCALLMASTNYVSQERSGEFGAVENLLKPRGYPMSGDIPVLNRKIFRGRRVSIREHPYVASIRRMLSHYLTAALLTKNLLITVAHPLFNVSVTELNVVLGENYSDRGSILFTVLLVIIHESFDPYTLKDDIALIRFYENISYEGNVKSIKLGTSHAELEGVKAFVTGWGRCDNMGTELCLDRSSIYYPDEKMDPMLRTVTFKMHIPSSYCESYKQFDVPLSTGMLCTGPAREQDQACPCFGSPGGLLVANVRLTGLLSWGFGCGYSYDLPLIYTDIHYYSAWIGHNIKIIRDVTHDNLTALFQATKAYILVQWLRETRAITPKLVFRTDKSLEPLSIDYEIAKLRGSITDVRDYIDGGAFHAEKEELYATLRSEFQKAAFKPFHKNNKIKTAPFIAYATLEEIAFNISEIFSVSDTTGRKGDPLIDPSQERNIDED